MALGSESYYYGNDHWKKFTFPLKSLTDALTIRERLLCSLEMAEIEKDPVKREVLLTTIIIGGGPTGVEVAGAVAELKKSILEKEFRNVKKEDVHIILIEGGPRLIPAFHPSLSDYARKQLEKMGVTVLTSLPVKDISANCVHTEFKNFRAANIIWAAGVRGHTLLENPEIKKSRDGRVIVDEAFRLPAYSNVYVIGDLAWYQHPHTFYGEPLPALSPAAIQAGKFVAGDILRRVNHKGAKLFHYRYKGIMSTIGRSAAVVQFPRFRMKGWLAWIIWVFVHIMYLVDFQNRIIVFLRWLWFYFTWKKGSRLITRIFELTVSDNCSGQDLQDIHEK
ncbi:MAG: NAD(P)/FAD-dependent oxidoreductase [Methanobacteriota archaeon]|nr:MAG: NAD(P)/FAD-dependent oxidoreductase [Euryarchaeota archaeon]